MLNRRLIKENAPSDYIITDEQLDKLDAYARLLIEWNERINLTAITDSEEITRLHIIDSFASLHYIKGERSVIDVGTGAGFPGLVIKIIAPNIKLTLLDSREKRVGFLNEVCKEISVDAQIILGRAEDMGRKNEHREQYDIATARAVASLDVLCEYCLPFVKIGGSLLAMKGREYRSEVIAAENAISTLSAEKGEMYEYMLPNGESRAIVELIKHEKMAEKYPRRAAAIKNKPLKIYE